MRRIRYLVGDSLSAVLSSRIIIRALRIMMQQGPHVLLTKIASRLKLRRQYQLFLLAQKNSEDSGNKNKVETRFLRYKPKVSIVVPVYNTGKRWLRLCIDSVRNQTYNNWELCIVDGGSKKHYIKKMLEEYARQDNRIKINILPENKGIAVNSNEALSLATGEFVGLLDHDDELAPDALYEIVKTLNEKTDIDFIYTDEDKISRTGRRADPHFKPDWAPDNLYTSNYITHFSVIRKTIIDKVGGFRSGYDGSQDYDLFLRVTDITSNIAHIPKVLYHWRITSQSVASSSNAKPYAYEAAKKAIQDSLKRRKIEAKVDYEVMAGYYRVQYKLLSSLKVSMIITTSDNAAALKRCVHSVLDKTQYDNYRLIIVDNGSREPQTFEYYEKIASNKKVVIVKLDKFINSSAIKNYAVSLVDSEYVIFLDDSTEIISRGWLASMLEYIQKEGIGIVGALLYYPNKTIYHAGMILGIGGVVGYSHRRLRKYASGYINRARTVQNVSSVVGACLATKREIFKDAGGFDVTYERTFSDVDFCLKVGARGYLIVYTPYAELCYHSAPHRNHHNTAEEKKQFKRDMGYFQKKWKEVLEKGDPYYNPNLTLDREDFSIKI